MRERSMCLEYLTLVPVPAASLAGNATEGEGAAGAKVRGLSLPTHQQPQALQADRPAAGVDGTRHQRVLAQHHLTRGQGPPGHQVPPIPLLQVEKKKYNLPETLKM